LTPGQRTTAWFFLIMAALFLVQTLVGGASQHYRAELSNFFGFNLAQYLPFNLMRTWHGLSFIEWMRLPGDVVFIAGGVLPLLWICFQGVRHARGPDLAAGTDSALFTEVTGAERGAMEGATAAGSIGERP
jgi:nitric oxide reductase subunit B